MIKQVFNVEQYWKVIVYYDVDFDLFNHITKDLQDSDASQDAIIEAYNMLKYKKAKAATFSNIEKHISIILFNSHGSQEDYLNSIVHEAEHVKQAMLQAYQVEDVGEPPAYTIGYLVSQMYHVFRDIVCNCLPN